MTATFIVPIDLAAHDGAEAFFTIFMAAFIGATLGWAARRREWVLFALVPAAAVSSLIEPVYDYLAHCWWTTDLTTSFTAFDGRIYCPTIFPLGYAMWIGLGSYAAYRLFSARPEQAWLLRAFVLLALCEPALELPWLHTDLFEYYGDQPFRVFGYSLVWDAINTGGVAINGAVLLWLADTGRLRGRGVALAAILPFSVIGFYCAAGWPVWLMMHTSASDVLIWAAGALSISLASAATYGAIRWVSSRATVLHA